MNRQSSEQLQDTPLAVSPSEAARRAGIGRTKLYEAISSGALPSFKIGTRRLIRLSALDDWLASFEDKAL
jgi:excisionase family DNA binding protein